MGIGIYLIPKSIHHIEKLEAVHKNHGQGRHTEIVDLHLSQEHCQVYNNLSQKRFYL